MANLLARLDVRDFSSSRVSGAGSPYGGITILGRADLASLPEWRQSFSHLRKDSRYYEILEDTICPEFEYGYLGIEGPGGTIRSIEPFFIVDQDLCAGMSPKLRAVAQRIRRIWPRFMTMRTLMVGCAAGEGHLSSAEPAVRLWEAETLALKLPGLARKKKASLLILKEFPAQYRRMLTSFIEQGYARIPSMPMTRLDLADYTSFEDYLNRAIKAKRRTEFRKKIKVAQESGPIELTVTANIGDSADEIYALYLQVFERAPLKFEKLTKPFFVQLSQRMPDKARFFIWRREGKIIAFSLCLIHDGILYGEYLGLDYAVALRLNLYFYMMRDIISWAIENGFKAIVSTSLSYAPKLQMRHVLEPLDLYVRHTSPIVNAALRHVLPLLEPTRSEPVLRRFPNYSDLWGDASRPQA